MPGKAVHQPLLVPIERRGAKAVAVAACRDSPGAPGFTQSQACKNSAAGPDLEPVAADPPIERRPVPQHGIDMTGDMRAILGADIPPTPEVVGRSIVGRAIHSLDRRQNVDRSRDLRTGGQTIPVAPAKAGAQSLPLA